MEKFIIDTNAKNTEAVVTPDKYSYFCKFDQLRGIVCSIGGPQYSIKDSCYIPMEELYPDECY